MLSMMRVKYPDVLNLIIDLVGMHIITSAKYLSATYVLAEGSFLSNEDLQTLH